MIKKKQIEKYRENSGDSYSEITLQQLETLNIPILNYYKADTNIYAGEYPYAEDEEIGFKKLSLLKEIGISYIIDLTEEGELIPYRQHIDSIEYLRFPIVDRGVPCSMNETKNICEIINRAIREGKFLYIHCWGGVGRTGTIVACWYVFNGYSYSEAIMMLNKRWKYCPKSRRRTHCPEYKHQENFIKEFYKYLNS